MSFVPVITTDTFCLTQERGVFVEKSSQADTRRAGAGKMTSRQCRIGPEYMPRICVALRHVGHAPGCGMVLRRPYLSWTLRSEKAEILLCMQGN
jgi:hypothetical protein